MPNIISLTVKLVKKELFKFCVFPTTLLTLDFPTRNGHSDPGERRAADHKRDRASVPGSNSREPANVAPIRSHQRLRNSAYLATLWQHSNLPFGNQSLAVNSGYRDRSSQNVFSACIPSLSIISTQSGDQSRNAPLLRPPLIEPHRTPPPLSHARFQLQISAIHRKSEFGTRMTNRSASAARRCAGAIQVSNRC